MARGLALALVFALLACSQTGRSRETTAVFSERGGELFRRYCADCHGLDATGSGPDAAQLRSPPADLTRIAERGRGSFPAARVASFIDGRFAPSAERSREMPVWGIRLREELPRTMLVQEIVRGQISMLVDHLRWIQRPAQGR